MLAPELSVNIWKCGEGVWHSRCHSSVACLLCLPTLTPWLWLACFSWSQPSLSLSGGTSARHHKASLSTLAISTLPESPGELSELKIPVTDSQRFCPSLRQGTGTCTQVVPTHGMQGHTEKQVLIGLLWASIAFPSVLWCFPQARTWKAPYPIPPRAQACSYSLSHPLRCLMHPALLRNVCAP